MAEASPSLLDDPITDTIDPFINGMFNENLQEQRDEILALQSIFNSEGNGKLKILSEVSHDNKGHFTLRITVCPKPINDSVRVELALPTGQCDNSAAAASVDTLHQPVLASNFLLNRSTSGWHWQGSFSVKYLSPLYLQATLPSSYPSQGAPQFHLTCNWLTPDQLTSLSLALDNLWSEGCQMPIIYTWVDWLEHGMLRHLDITDVLVLQPSIPEAGEDQTDVGVPWEESIGEVIACLIRYNSDQMDIEFCQTLQECHVCYCEKPGQQFFRLHECKHHYCHECMAEFCELHVREGTVEALRCPDRKCNALIPPYVVQAVMSPEAYQRWEQLLLQKTLDAMTDTVYCPRCASLVIAEDDEELHLARCPVCYFTFCTQCERSWHQGRRCMTDDELLEEIENQGKVAMNTGDEQRVKKLLRKMKDQIKTRKVLKGNTVNCPQCRALVLKIGGCNNMHCTCGCSFCWVCGKKIAGYTHFTPEGCYLFPEDAKAKVERLPAEGFLRIQARLEVNPELTNNRIFCPTCKQLNLKGKDHNNHIKCWNCKGNFCFQCKQRITGNIMLHFRGPCMQHS